MRRVVVSLMIVMVSAGCAAKRSALLLERQTHGPLSEEPLVAQLTFWSLEPVMQTQTQHNVSVMVNYASADFLRNFFQNTHVFGAFAGHNPYYLEQVVFYVKLANHSDKKVYLDPTGFVLLDDRENQYRSLSVDDVTAFAQSRQPVSTVTRGVLEEARPGYFGVGLPIGRIFSAQPQGRFALLQQSSLQVGYLYPGVAHDGLIAFWNPTPLAKKLQLLVASVKTDYDAEDHPHSSWDFTFTFDATHN